MVNLENLLKQFRKGWSLEQNFYTNPEVLEHEKKVIWSKYWIFAGFSSEIPQPGDYFTYSIINQSIIVIRGEEGKIFAHHNTCRHRGSLVCTDERGHTASLKCPYHNWVYEKDGKLRSARLMDDDFDKTQFGLHPVSLQVLEGAIFVSLSDNPPDFSHVIHDLKPYLHPFKIDQSKVAYRDRYILDANWKLIVENFRECYHCGPAHAEYCSAVVGANLQEDREAIWDACKKEWNDKGLATELIDRDFHYAIRYPLRPGTMSYSLNGKKVAPLMGNYVDYDNGVVGLLTYPNFFMDGVNDYIWAMRITPVDSLHTIVDLTWLVHENAEDGKDYDLERLTEFWKITGEQDWILSENNQKGILSEKYTPGPLSESEIDVMKFGEWYINNMKV